MCFRTSKQLIPGDEQYFIIDLKIPVEDMVLVQARIEWTRSTDVGQSTLGASFLRSSKGWLAALEDSAEDFVN